MTKAGSNEESNREFDRLNEAAKAKCKAIARAAVGYDREAVPLVMEALKDEGCWSSGPHYHMEVRAIAVRALAYLSEPHPPIVSRLREMIRDSEKFSHRVALACLATLLDFKVLNPHEMPGFDIPHDPGEEVNILRDQMVFSLWASSVMIDPRLAREIAVPVLLDQSETYDHRATAISALTRFRRQYAGMFIDVLCEPDAPEGLKDCAALALEDVGLKVERAAKQSWLPWRRSIDDSYIYGLLRSVNPQSMFKGNIIQTVLTD